MNETVKIVVSIAVVFVLTILISKKFKLSTRYERAPRELNSWSALDKGLDPTDRDGE